MVCKKLSSAYMCKDWRAFSIEHVLCHDVQKDVFMLYDIYIHIYIYAHMYKVLVVVSDDLLLSHSVQKAVLSFCT